MYIGGCGLFETSCDFINEISLQSIAVGDLELIAAPTNDSPAVVYVWKARISTHSSFILFLES